MKRKIISLMFSFVMILAMGSSSFASSDGFANFRVVNNYSIGQFSDVLPTSWYAENVQKAYEYGLVKGVDATSFNPNGNITVAETLALACRLYDIYNGGDGNFAQ
ncbi:MAG: S-layer homology domain-containing protein, partial [Anaerovoracaceae bacterium]|nr:S-layer homology domain-containing protein [Anaerovoracaceae bacterium]